MDDFRPFAGIVRYAQFIKALVYYTIRAARKCSAVFPPDFISERDFRVVAKLNENAFIIERTFIIGEMSEDRFFFLNEIYF